MKFHHKILASLYAAFLFYTFLSFFLGPDGFLETKHLEDYRNILQDNCLKMERIGNKLLSEVSLLQEDADSISIEARKLGLYTEDEGIIFLSGSYIRKSGYSVGSLIREFSYVSTPIPTIRYISMILGLLVFLSLTIFSRRKYVHTYNKRFQQT